MKPKLKANCWYLDYRSNFLSQSQNSQKIHTTTYTNLRMIHLNNDILITSDVHQTSRPQLIINDYMRSNKH